jgi:ubiquinol-cytochrome c reductase iron-sulfur subunit
MTGRASDPGPVTERRIERLVAALFALTALTGLALLGLYIAGGQPQLEGLLLALCLGSLGIGIILWSQELMPERQVEEPRHRLASDPGARAALAEAIEEEAGFTRRRFLIRMLLTAVGGLAAALAIPVFSLGPAPGRELFTTSWRRGSRLVGLDGQPIRAADLAVDAVTTVFPEGHAGDAQAQTLLIRVPADLLRLPPDRAVWAPEGYVAYSKVCTHAGCPVGLYRAAERRLICPCHQSTFDVLDGARPVFGPAARPLPQLPIQLQPDGTFVALGDFDEPIGPSFWNMTEGES